MKEEGGVGDRDVAHGQPRSFNVPVITTGDMVRLTDMIEYLMRSGEVPTRSLLALKKRLACCKVMPFSGIGPDRVTMHSRVELQNVDSGVVEVFTLVYPKEAGGSPQNVSVLSAMGTALLGSQKGDLIQWEGEKGLVRYRVLRILYQPEAAGDYHL